jgi:hypothetical protein
MLRLLQSLFQGRDQARMTAASASKTRHARPGLEVLEDRLMPSTLGLVSNPPVARAGLTSDAVVQPPSGLSVVPLTKAQVVHNGSSLQPQNQVASLPPWSSLSVTDLLHLSAVMTADGMNLGTVDLGYTKGLNEGQGTFTNNSGTAIPVSETIHWTISPNSLLSNTYHLSFDGSGISKDPNPHGHQVIAEHVHFEGDFSPSVFYPGGYPTAQAPPYALTGNLEIDDTPGVALDVSDPGTYAWGTTISDAYNVSTQLTEP